MSTKNKWLIKSDYKILGPYSYDQVEDLILKKQISLIDEIRDMDHRWTFVREVPEFKSFVEKVRRDLDKKSDLTHTLQTALQNTTTRAEDTDPAKSEVYTGVDFSQVEVPRNTAVTTPAIETPPIDVPKPRIVSRPETPRPSQPRPNQLLKITLVVGLLLCAGLLGWYYNTTANQSRSEKMVFQQIRKYNLYAQDDKSIELYKKLSPESQEKILVDIISLWPKLEAIGVLSAGTMLDLMSKGKVIGNERKSQYQLVKFYKAFNMGDVQNARDALVKAIDLDPSSLEIKENDALFSFNQKEYAKAEKAFKNLYDLTSQGRFLYGMLLSSIHANTLKGSEAFEMIEKHLNTRVDFGKELALIQLYIIKKFLPENTEMFNRYYDLFIQFPYQFPKYFKVSNLVSQEMYSWDYLSEVKRELSQGKEKSMLEMQFLMEKGDYTHAQDYLQDHLQAFDATEKYNLQVALDYFKKSYAEALNRPTNNTPLYLSTQLYMLWMNTQDKNENSQKELAYVNDLMKQKQLFANWAQLMPLRLPQDKEVIKNIINKDSLYANDFLPYLELKAALNE